MQPNPHRRPAPAVLHFARWPRGEPHSARSFYVERFWLPLLGPTATIILRNAEMLHDREVEVVEASRAFGLGPSSTWNGPFLRSLRRLEHWDLARIVDVNRLTIVGLSDTLPDLDEHRRKRLPLMLRAALAEGAWA